MTTSNIIPFVFEVDADPSTNNGVTAPIGSVAYLTVGSGGVWHKTGSADTAWSVGGIIGQSTGAPVSQTPNQTNTTSLAGALTFAQSDHVHNIPTATPVSIGATNVQSTGSALTFAQSDHQHQGVHSFHANSGSNRFGDLSLQAGTNVTITDDGSGNFTIAASAPSLTELQVTAGAGLVANYAAGTCWINGVFYSISASSITLTASIAAGAIFVNTSGVVSQNATGVMPPNCVPMATFVTGASSITSITDQRAFPDQNLVFGLVGDITTITPNASTAAGATSRYADAGHTHAIAVAAAVTQNPDQSNATGSSSSFARADHVHNIPTASAVSLTTASTNTTGISTSFARADHTHQISTGTPVSIGTANAASSGGALTYAASDHVHQGVLSFNANGGTARFGALQLTSGTNVTVTDNGSGNFTIAAAVPNLTALQVSIGTGLAVNYTAGSCWINGTYYAISAGSVTGLTANTTLGAVYVNTSGVVTANTTGTMPPNCVPLATYVTGASSVTTVTDERAYLDQNLIFGLVGDITTIVPNASASAGATSRYADAGHTHAIAVAVAATQGPDNANAAGSSTSFARADHVHNIPTAAAVTLNTASTNGVGSTTNFARADHTHAITSATAVTISSNANALGASTGFANASHTHQLTAGTAVADSIVQYDGTNWQAVYPEAILASSRAWDLYEEWVASGPSGNLGWTATTGGGGSTVTMNSSLAANNHPGIVQLNAGSGSGRYAGLTLSTNQIILGGGAITLEFEVYVENLSTGTNAFSMRMGIGDQSNADFNNGVYFEYTQATSANWLIKTAAAGTRTSTATTTAVTAAAWTRLTIQINAAASSVTYLINGTSVGTVTTNIPTVATGLAANIVMGTTTTARAFDIDYLSLNQRFTSGR